MDERQPNPVKKLASALQECVEPPGREERTEKLASALQECLNSAVESGYKKVAPRLDRMDETLRMVWKQSGGSPDTKLPIDG